MRPGLAGVTVVPPASFEEWTPASSSEVHYRTSEMYLMGKQGM